MLNGYKTYSGLVIILLGFIGVGDLISEAEVATAIDNVAQFAGILIAFYGRLVTRAK